MTQPESPHDYAHDWPTCYGQGPAPCSVMLVGEAPGWQEIKQKQPFVGPSGDVLWTFARRYAGLSRSDCYVTNLVKHCVEGTRTRPSKEKISEQEIAYWAPELVRELKRVQPSHIITLGAYAAQRFLGQVTMEECWGLPYQPSISLGSGDFDFADPVIIPVHHPANGLHRPKEFQWTAWGLEAAGQIIRSGGPTMPVDQHPKPSYRVGAPPGIGPVLAIDTEGWADDPWCLQGSDREGEGWLVWAKYKNDLAWLVQMLKAVRPLIVLQNATHDLPVLRAMGVDLVRLGLTIVDTMVMSYNCQDLPLGLKPMAWRLAGMRMQSWRSVVGKHDLAVVRGYLGQVVAGDAKWPKPANTRQHGIARLAKTRLAIDDPEEARTAWEDIEPERRKPVEDALGPMPRLRLSDVPQAELIPYACADPDATLRCYNKLKKRVVGRDLLTVVQMDNLVLPLVDRMQTIGLPASRPKIQELSRELKVKEDQLTGLISTLTEGQVSNPGSGDQIASWCQDQWIKNHKCGLVRMTKGKTRECTDEESLATIAKDHQAIPLIINWKELNKIRTSYADKLLVELPADCIYHPDFNITNVVSGRLAEWILTFPAETEIGRRIRDCFEAPPGWAFGSVDLAQIELRLAAEESADPAMMQAFAEGADLHTRTAALIFHKPDSQVNKLTERYPCKTLNFRVLYGGAAQGLSRQLIAMGLREWTVEKCEVLIANWFKVYAGVAGYVKQAGAEARQFGYVKDRWGRRRYLPAIYLDDIKLSSEAERQAFNLKIQAGAQGIAKRAEIRLWFKELPSLWKQGVQVEPVLQAHDEIMVLFKQEHEEVVSQAMLRCMSADQSMFKVPIVSAWASGPTWGSLKG